MPVSVENKSTPMIEKGSKQQEYAASQKQMEGGDGGEVIDEEEEELEDSIFKEIADIV